MDHRSTPSPASAGGLTTRIDRDYAGGYADETIAEIGVADGEIGAADPNLWGENAATPYGAKLAVMAHATQLGLIASVLRDSLRPLIAAITATQGRLEGLSSRGVFEIGRWQEAALLLADVRHGRRLLSLGDPKRHVEPKRWGALALLFVGELGLLASALQSQGLSDLPLVPGVSLTDELHIAALATVTAMAMLAHLAGESVRSIEYTLERRRLEPDADARAALPPVSWNRVVMGGTGAIVAIVMLVGMVLLRTEYLAATQAAISSTPFVLTQLGLLAAAIWIGFHFADPTAELLRSAVEKEATASATVASTMSAAETLVGETNANIEDIESEITKAVAHAVADGANADRQAGALYPMQVARGLPEPVAEKLFAEGLPTVEAHTHAELRDLLAAGGTFPTFARADMSTLSDRYERAINAVEEHAAALHDIEHDLLHPRRRSAPAAPTAPTVAPGAADVAPVATAAPSDDGETSEDGSPERAATGAPALHVAGTDADPVDDAAHATRDGAPDDARTDETGAAA